MSTTAWLEGEPIDDPQHAMPVTSRGLHYGDGLFETMRLQAGRIRLIDSHLRRLRQGCERLNLALPPPNRLLQELEAATTNHEPAVLKLLVMRAGSGRGYRSTANGKAIRLMLLYPWTEAPSELRVQWCSMRLGRNTRLAGMKHLNRLEQVMAQSELSAEVDEGLMLDSEGELISAIAGNVFIVHGRTLRTPDLRSCGVRGVMRDQVIATGKTLGLAIEECPVWPADLDRADEVFVTNAIRGVRPVVRLGAREWPVGAITSQLQSAVDAT